MMRISLGARASRPPSTGIVPKTAGETPALPGASQRHPAAHHRRRLGIARAHLVDAAFDGKVSAQSAVKASEVQLLAGQEHERLHVSAAVAKRRAA